MINANRKSNYKVYLNHHFFYSWRNDIQICFLPEPIDMTDKYNIQGIAINCQKLILLLGGKYQLNIKIIVYLGNFELQRSSHLSIASKIQPKMKNIENHILKKRLICIICSKWPSFWMKIKIIWHKCLSAHVFRVVHA